MTTKIAPNAVICLRNADEIENSANPDQIAVWEI